MSSNRTNLMAIAAMMAMTDRLFLVPGDEPQEPKAVEPSKEDLTRRAEKNARALAKAQAKRERKAAKRIVATK